MFTGRRAYLIGCFFAFSWLAFLAFPVGDLLRGHYSRKYAAGGLLALSVFAAVYVWFWLRALRGGQPAATLLGLVAMTVLSALLLLAGPSSAGTTFIYLVVSAGFAFDWRRGLAAVGAITLLLTGLAVFERVPTLDWVATVGEIALIGLCMIAVRSLVDQNRQLRDAREEIGRLAVSEERLRFARDLHDLLGHSLSVVVLKAELATRLAGADPERAAAEMADVERVARQALREVREAVSGYRQPSLGSELNSAREVLASAGIECRLRNHAGPLAPAAESVLGWAVREAVTNVVRHSQARSCAITLTRDGGRVALEISDDGRGTDNLVYGSGLRGLEERVGSRGGTVSARSTGGFTLTVTLPVLEVATPQPEAVARTP